MAFTHTSKLLPGRNTNLPSSLQNLRVGEFLFELKEALKAAGWTVMSSSDGLTYFPASDGITSGSSSPTAGNFGNALAWFRIRQPSGGAGAYAGTREFTIQVTDTQNFRIKYSKTGVFTGGSPSATQTPSGAGEQIIVGSGTDASPNGAGSISSVQHSAAVHFAVGAAAEGFSFAMVLRTITGTAQLFYFDAMKAGAYPVADVDPYVMQLSGTNTITNIFTNYKLGLGGASFMNATIYTPACGGSGGIGALLAQDIGVANLSSGLYQTVPTVWVHYDGPVNAPYKGVSTLFMTNGAGQNQNGLHAVSDKSGQNYLATRDPASNFSLLLKWNSAVRLYR